MTPEEADALTSYAKSMELSRPALCALIIHRELRRPRLKKLLRDGSHSSSSEGPNRVTVRISDQDLKQAFADHVKSCRIGSDDAAALLFRADLKERLIYRELAWNGNRC